jgi:hypothetical protein
MTDLFSTFSEPSNITEVVGGSKSASGIVQRRKSRVQSREFDAVAGSVV